MFAYPGSIEVDCMEGYLPPGGGFHRQTYFSQAPPSVVASWYETVRGPARKEGETDWTWEWTSDVGIHQRIHVRPVLPADGRLVEHLPPEQRNGFATLIDVEDYCPPRPWWKFW